MHALKASRGKGWSRSGLGEEVDLVDARPRNATQDRAEDYVIWDVHIGKLPASANLARLRVGTRLTSGRVLSRLVFTSRGVGVWGEADPKPALPA